MCHYGTIRCACMCMHVYACMCAYVHVSMPVWCECTVPFFLSQMAPTGCGKTTLLDLLTGRRTEKYKVF